jgi:hypothetical protein
MEYRRWCIKIHFATVLIGEHHGAMCYFVQHDIQSLVLKRPESS